jgi:two-component system, chemotaxis family, protein-glutamate methylesterase/glutaminase
MARPTADASRAVALGASAGGLPALQEVLGGLSADFPAAVLVVIHLDRHHKSLLPLLLPRHVKMPVKIAAEGDVIEPSVIYLAVPDFHLQADKHRITLVSSDLVHFTRPAIDNLFESVALVYGNRAVGVILTGTGVDGARGIAAIRASGGATIVQDPEEAAYPGMPRAAIATGCADLVLQLAEIAAALTRVCAADPGPRSRA